MSSPTPFLLSTMTFMSLSRTPRGLPSTSTKSSTRARMIPQFGCQIWTVRVDVKEKSLYLSGSEARGDFCKLWTLSSGSSWRNLENDDGPKRAGVFLRWGRRSELSIDLCGRSIHMSGHHRGIPRCLVGRSHRGEGSMIDMGQTWRAGIHLEKNEGLRYLE